MPYDIHGDVINKGDYIRAMFRVDEVYEGTALNVKGTLVPSEPCNDVYCPIVTFQASTVDLVGSADIPK